MPDNQVIDFAASRRSQNRIAANVKSAMEEASNIAGELQQRMLVAHLGALTDMDASDSIAAAQDACERLMKQLGFAGALAERALERQS